MKEFHQHRTRHIFARIVSEFTGDITSTKNALDHQNRSTTRINVQRIAVQRDLSSNEISGTAYLLCLNTSDLDPSPQAH